MMEKSDICSQNPERAFAAREGSLFSFKLLATSRNFQNPRCYSDPSHSTSLRVGISEKRNHRFAVSAAIAALIA
jgi:hypothetical protein